MPIPFIYSRSSIKMNHDHELEGIFLDSWMHMYSSPPTDERETDKKGKKMRENLLQVVSLTICIDVLNFFFLY